jgi:hypothetical protein
MLGRKKRAALLRKRKALQKQPEKQVKRVSAKSLIARGVPRKLVPRYEHRSSEMQINRPEVELGKNLTPLVESPKYSGERKLIGIATLHKSNMVPIFSQEEAIDAARMRRN